MKWIFRRTRDHIALETLSEYLDGRLPAVEVQHVEGHVEACSSCREELEGLRETVGLLRQVPMLQPRQVFTLGEAPSEAPARPSMRVPSWAYGAAASVAIAAFALVTTADLGGLLVGESPSPEIARQATETLGAAPEADLTGTLPPQSPQPAAVPEDGTPALVAAAQAPGAVVEAAQPTGAPDQEAFSAAANADVQKLQPAPVAPEEAAPSLPAEPVVADERATAASSVDNAAASEETKTETATGEGLPQPEAATSEPVAPPAPVPGPTGTVVAQPVPAPTAPALAVTAPGATAPAEEATPTLTPPSLAVTAPGATVPSVGATPTLTPPTEAVAGPGATIVGQGATPTLAPTEVPAPTPTTEAVTGPGATVVSEEATPTLAPREMPTPTPPAKQPEEPVSSQDVTEAPAAVPVATPVGGTSALWHVLEGVLAGLALALAGMVIWRLRGVRRAGHFNVPGNKSPVSNFLGYETMLRMKRRP